MDADKLVRYEKSRPEIGRPIYNKGIDEKEIREDAESSLCLPNFYSNEELPSKNRNHNWLGVLFPR
jgi:hypothetical protein